MLRVSILRKAANNGDGFVRRIVTNEPYPNFSFDISKISKDSKARLGSINTPHGSIETPSFVFCATKAAMKAITPQQLRETSAQIMLSNTYHLMLSPGADLIEKMGGLQKFTAWKGPMLTDSGGYQIFSMGHGSVSNDIKSSRAIPGDIIPSKFEKTLLGIDEQGAKFRSYVDQSVQELTPEKSIGIQRKLGADLIVVFDECTPFNVDRQYTTDSMQRSHRWATRSLNEFNRLEVQGSKYRGKQALYGIVQGGVFKDLRDESAAFVNDSAFFGTAIGGCLGSTRREMHDIVKHTCKKIRDDRPIHLLGIGGVRDIFHGVRQGVDTFDCVHPTRNARHGGALVMAAHWSEKDFEKEPTNYELQSVGNRWKKVSGYPLSKRLEHFNKMLPTERMILRAHLAGGRVDADARSNTAAAVAASLPKQEEEVETRRETRGQFLNRKIANAILHMEDVRSDRLVIMDGKTGELIVTEQVTLQRGDVVTSVLGEAAVLDSEGDVAEVDKKKEKIKESIHILRTQYRTDPRPIDPTCGCYTCRNFSRAYLHHVFKSKESVAGTLMTIHNAFFMNRLMTDIRKGIAEDNLDAVERRFVHPELKLDLDEVTSVVSNDED